MKFHSTSASLANESADVAVANSNKPVADLPPGAPGNRRLRRGGVATRRLLTFAGPALAVALLAAAGARFLHTPSGPASLVGQTASPGTGGADDGLAALEVATSQRPEDATAWQRLGAAYLGRATRTADPSYYDEARRAYEQAEQLRPGDGTTLIGQGTLALSLHRFDEALAKGNAALAALPRNAEALAVVVDAEVELGRYDDAALHAQQLLDRRPALAALSRASYQRELRGDLAGALTAMTQAEAAGGGSVGVGPASFDLATVIALQGDILFAQGNAAGAAARYRRALDIVADLPVAVVGLARSDAASGQLDAAIDRLTPFTERTPLLGAVTLLGDLQRLVGRPDTTEGLVNTIATLQRANGAVVDLELAVHLADRGTPDVALAEAAYRSRPSVYGADALAWTLLRAGRAADAVVHAEEALRLGTADALVRFHAAAVFAAAGDQARASSELQRALSTNPNFTFGLRDEVRALAGELGVMLPRGWENLR